MSSLTKQQIEDITYTLLGEAAGEGYEGMAAVAHVIRNRAESGRYPSDPAKVAKQSKQFSTWNSGEGGNNPTGKYSKDSKSYRAAERAVKAVFSGAHSDPTGGATHYWAPRGMKGKKDPYWAASETTEHGRVKIGNHIFLARAPAKAAVPPTVPPRRPDTVLGRAIQPLPAPAPLTFGNQGLTTRKVSTVKINPQNGRPVDFPALRGSAMQRDIGTQAVNPSGGRVSPVVPPRRPDTAAVPMPRPRPKDAPQPAPKAEPKAAPAPKRQTAKLPSGKTVEVGRIYSIGGEDFIGGVKDGKGTLTKAPKSIVDEATSKSIVGAAVRSVVVNEASKGIRTAAEAAAAAAPRVAQGAMDGMSSIAGSVGNAFTSVFGSKPAAPAPAKPAPKAPVAGLKLPVVRTPPAAPPSAPAPAPKSKAAVKASGRTVQQIGQEADNARLSGYRDIQEMGPSSKGAVPAKAPAAATPSIGRGPGVFVGTGGFGTSPLDGSVLAPSGPEAAVEAARSAAARRASAAQAQVRLDQAAAARKAEAARQAQLQAQARADAVAKANAAREAATKAQAARAAALARLTPAGRAAATPGISYNYAPVRFAGERTDVFGNDMAFQPRSVQTSDRWNTGY